MVKYYEVLSLLRTSTTDAQMASLCEALEKLIVSHSGKLKSHDKWGKLRLAYPVENQDYGSFMLSRYEVPVATSAVLQKDIETLLRIKFGNMVIRFARVSLSKTEFDAEYKRPDSVTAGPSSNNRISAALPSSDNLDAFRSGRMEREFSEVASRRVDDAVDTDFAEEAEA